MRRRRGVALGALALASTTTLAAVVTASPAVASSHKTSAKTPAYYAGQAQGNVLGLNIDLPVKLPSLPNPLGVDLIHLEGNAVHDPLKLASNTTALATSTASLITGTLVDTLENTLHLNLNRTAHVSLNGKSHDESRLLAIPAKPLADLSVGDLVANLTKLTDSTSSAANGILANIGTLDDLLGAQTVAQIQSLLNTTNLTTTLQTTVDKVLTTLQSLTGTTPVVGEAVNTITNTVNTILKKVNNLVNNLGTTPLVQIDVHDTNQSVSPSADGVKAISTLGLVDVNVLGGLLSINGFHSQATAFANGTPGGASTSTSATKPLIKINAANALCAQVSADGISLCNINGLGLPASVTQQLNQLLSQVTGTLNTIIGKILGNVPLISETPGSSHIAKNGKSASAVAPAYNISVGHLLTVTLGDGVSASAAALQNAPAKKIVVLNNPENTPKNLPFTGINLGELGLAAMVLLGVALVVRRRLLTP
jgi:hypothetical protein